MVVGTEQENSEAVNTVLRSLDDPETAGLILEEQANVLRSILSDPTFQKLIKANDRLENGRNQVEKQDTNQIVRDVVNELDPSIASDDNAAELVGLLQEPHFRALIQSHDAVAFRTYAIASLVNQPAASNGFGSGQPIRMVGLHKIGNKPMGMTLKIENNELVVARIIHGATIDRQGLLHVGDKIKEVNGKDMGGNAEELQKALSKSTGKIFLKVLPSNVEAPQLCQVYMRAHFDYDPKKDNLIPCQEVGLAFKNGDVLQIVEQDDANWWQARKVDGSGETGIIPSEIFEERRKSFVKKERTGGGFLCGSKKKQKMMYRSSKIAELDRHEMLIYEEVARMPPFRRKTLILIGAQGVGRRTLKNKLIVRDRERFGTTIPHTSREPRVGETDGVGYYFVSRDEMERETRAGKFLEHGEYEGNLYGTKVDTIREVARSGKMCILDVNPSALKILKTPEFMPLIVFIASPPLDELREIHKRAVSDGTMTKKQTEEEMQRTVHESERLFSQYSHYFDLTILNDDTEDAFNKLRDAIEAVGSEPQWVPVSWVY